MNQREAGMMTITGVQGVGKTYLNQHIIADYCRDKPATKVRGRKCLIFDTNGEYTKTQFDKNGVKNFEAKTIMSFGFAIMENSPALFEKALFSEFKLIISTFSMGKLLHRILPL